MAMVDIKQLHCPQCGSTNHIHIYKNINAQEDFKLRDKILSGQLFDFYCPYCEYRARLYYPCLYNDVKNKFMIYFIPGIEKGQMIGIIGGTGSGKSSVVNLLSRFYDATEGKVLLNGVDVKDYPIEILREKIGVVPQKAVLFKGTIRENICWGKEDATDEEIREALKIAQAAECVEEKGLDFFVEQGGRNLSGGQRQRLTIARAVVKNPHILILDDSASALDFATDAKLRKAISEMSKCMTIFVVSQRTSSMMHADQILVLEDGEMAAIGTHEELLKNCEIYREIYQTSSR